MVRRNPMKEKGKLRFSEYFKKLNIGDKVAVKKDMAVNCNFPKRIQGRTGVIVSKRGRCYVIKLNEFNKEKTFIIEPIHLKKITNLGENKND